jgi:hypothetical protein
LQRMRLPVPQWLRMYIAQLQRGSKSANHNQAPAHVDPNKMKMLFLRQ